MRTLRIATSALAVFLLLGCSGHSEAESGDMPVATSTPTPRPTLGPGETAIARERGTITSTPTGADGLINCGVERLELVPGPIQLDRTARECLWSAYHRGEGAAFTAIWPTIEGDPIATHLVLLGPGVIRVEIDMTQDKFAGTDQRRIQAYQCRTMALVTPAEGVGERFEVAGCGPDGPFTV
jgi:hypothetical protein